MKVKILQVIRVVSWNAEKVMFAKTKHLQKVTIDHKW